MKKGNWTILITLGIILIFAVTNPSSDEHKQAVKTKVNTFIQNSYETDSTSKNEYENAGHNLGVMFGSALVDKFIDNAVSRDSYIVFSITKINWQGKTKAIGCGFLGNVFLSKEIDKPLRDSFRETDDVTNEEAPIIEEDPIEEQPLTE